MTSPESSGGVETILIAEDDPLVRGFIVRVLEKAGYTALAAVDGVDALRVFRDKAESISLAILDVVMPHLGGRALCQKLREIDPNIRVIFCSGHDPELDQTQWIAELGFPLLQKPVDPGVLLQTVRATLDTPQSDSSSVAPKLATEALAEEVNSDLGTIPLEMTGLGPQFR